MSEDRHAELTRLDARLLLAAVAILVAGLAACDSESPPVSETASPASPAPVSQTPPAVRTPARTATAQPAGPSPTPGLVRLPDEQILALMRQQIPVWLYDEADEQGRTCVEIVDDIVPADTDVPRRRVGSCLFDPGSMLTMRLVVDQDGVFYLWSIGVLVLQIPGIGGAASTRPSVCTRWTLIPRTPH